jgi:hypothetical protein
VFFSLLSFAVYFFVYSSRNLSRLLSISCLVSFPSFLSLSCLFPWLSVSVLSLSLAFCLCLASFPGFLSLSYLFPWAFCLCVISFPGLSVSVLSLSLAFCLCLISFPDFLSLACLFPWLSVAVLSLSTYIPGSRCTL